MYGKKSRQRNRAVAEADFITNTWTNGSDQIAFGRGDLGFVVINASVRALKKDLQTGLKPGMYCDRLSALGCHEIEVRQDGTEAFNIEPFSAVAFDTTTFKEELLA